MAVKQYGYYVKGNKVAIVEKDTQFDNDTSSRDFGPGSERAQWKSPKSTVTNGLEFEYVYSPEYFIDETDKVDTQIDTYLSLDGLLKLIDAASDNYSQAPQSLSDGSFIVLKNAGKFNGLHKVKDAGIGYITLYTKFSGSATVAKAFDQNPSLYYNVDILNDEDDTIPVSNYLSKAIVYYVKGRIAEDVMNLEAKEYFMKQFRKMLEKHNNTRVGGLRITAVGSHGIL
jgi:hypothetical protein|tara:strand:- start:788 stop:1471 length:684 start_codon:yes stop_codon:yes gene_type:complete